MAAEIQCKLGKNILKKIIANRLWKPLLSSETLHEKDKILAGCLIEKWVKLKLRDPLHTTGHLLDPLKKSRGSDVFTGSRETPVAWNGINFNFFLFDLYSKWKQVKENKQWKWTNSKQNYNNNNGYSRCSNCSEVLLLIFTAHPPFGKLLHKRSVQINSTSVEELVILEIKLLKISKVNFLKIYHYSNKSFMTEVLIR